MTPRADWAGGLVISRAVKESIVIIGPSGERIVVALADVRGENKARIAVSAPMNFAIHRAEVLAQIESERARDAQRVPVVAIGPDSTDRLSQHRPTGS